MSSSTADRFGEAPPVHRTIVGGHGARNACGADWMSTTSSPHPRDITCPACTDDVDTGVPERPAHFEDFDEAEAGADWWPPLSS